MFTGIIEELGKLQYKQEQGQTMVLTIEAKLVLEDVKLGDSIAINGVCLTVVKSNHNSFSVDVMPETYKQTNLSGLQTGSPVNLERAMPANGRFGGHIVQGHVDGTGTIAQVTAQENAVIYRIKPASATLMHYIIPKGSITIDGISLTVVSTRESDFTVSIIPHTLAQTVLKHKTTGDSINLECDILAKYIERFTKHQTPQTQGTITEALLSKHGYM